jgi:beta-glucosidase
LQGFVKTNIKLNEVKNLEIRLAPRNFSHWSVDTKTWQIRGGSYQIFIGSSSENIHLKAIINLEQVLEVL